jgi:pyruvate,orthophosphate dikinase
MPEALKATVSNNPSYIYQFGSVGVSNTVEATRNILGGKGFNLAGMMSLGLPVPPGFIISTVACHAFYEHGQQLPQALLNEWKLSLAQLEKTLGKNFGGTENPLLVSVRSGAPVSMPGMMDTILNVGLNDKTVEVMAKQTGNARFAYDSYRRLIQMYGNVVMEVDGAEFSHLLEKYKEAKDVEQDTALVAEDWQQVIVQYKALIKKQTGQEFPQDVHEQLKSAVTAVFRSWHNERAVFYRKLNGISESLGTGVVIQAMVFGNLGDDSATGVTFTRNPSTGENVMFGEFLLNAQGEDVVAGIRTPETLEQFAVVMPEAHAELVRIKTLLEGHYKDMQDIEFTVDRNKLWLLQTRGGKRSAKAAIRIASEMVGEGLISKEQAVLNVNPASIDQLLHPSIDPSFKGEPMAKGLPASPGAVIGKLAFTAEEAVLRANAGHEVILVRHETCPDDIMGMQAARGILTVHGGMTSHAAVVARGMGVPCVTGASKIGVDTVAKTLKVGNQVFGENDLITIDGHTGAVFAGAVPVKQSELPAELQHILDWANQFKKMAVRTNAETVQDIKTALTQGAEGIGLARTEHMFFEKERLFHMQAMIVAESEEQRKQAIDALLPLHTEDFVEILKLMDGLPVTIRLLDPPLHEFLPEKAEDIAALAKASGLSVQAIEKRIHGMAEVNPMLGHRGSRLGVTYPEVYAMEAKAIFAAALQVQKNQKVQLEIMIPIVASRQELQFFRDMIEKIAADMKVAEQGLQYTLGVMIELPAAAIRAGEIAESADFFSFGTNDLTQTALGLSRDDAGSFLPAYQKLGLLEHDPFVTLHKESVGELVKMAVKAGRATKPKLKIGICGEHGGDPASIQFFAEQGLDYVSCSPFRIPVAKLAAAQAAIKAAK